MEKKKLLLVAVSVGIFLVIVIGASIIVMSKQDNKVSTASVSPVPPGMSGTISMSGTPTTPAVPGDTAPVPADGVHSPAITNPANPSLPATVDPTTMVRNPGEVNSLKPAPEGKSSDNINYFNYGDAIYSSDVRIEKISPDTGRNTTVNPPPKAAVADPIPAAQPKSTTSPAPAAKPAAAAPASATTAAPKPPAVTKVYTDYWVQTGSFSTKARADGVKESLSAKGISSVIEVSNVDSKTWYRVRVGPYTSKNEAEYWLSLIKSINGFEGSQIWSSQSKR